LKQLTQLKYLKLGGSLLNEPVFPRWLGSCHFPVLEDLLLFEGITIPCCIGKFTSLTALYIEQEEGSEVPESIGCLELLKVLQFSHDEVFLPTSFSKLTALEVLDVSTDMQYFALVEHFHKLESLTFSERGPNVIVPYPEFLWTFTSLEFLELWGSLVPALPDALGNLQKLECLHLCCHQGVKEFPETIGNLTRLTTLKIENCSRLEKLPESIGNLKLLRELEICDCEEVWTLPESIGQLQRLEKLELTDLESFQWLPSSLGKLHALKVLIINNCGEVSLPDSFTDLVFGDPAENISLENVSFIGNTKVVPDGLDVTEALGFLKEDSILHCDNGF
jgi:hypothetical protein